MKHRKIPALTFMLAGIVMFFINTEPAKANFRGGEITWNCTSNGDFEFIMKLYRDCAGPGTFADTLWIRSNAPGFDSIGMVRVAITDITPVCDCPAGAALSCATATQTGSGALEEHIYTSSAFFPNGVPLTGVPPVTGYYFAFEGCCRAPTANLAATNNSFAIRSIMYPYNNANISNCFDQSTLFFERSPIVTCSGSSNWYIHRHMDPELDTIAWEWAHPLQAINTPVTAYQLGYGYNFPLPGLVHDSANIPATLNWFSGDLGFTSNTPGSFTVVIKATARKCGIKVAEIFKEMPVIIVPCAPNNVPDISVNGQLSVFTDTVYPGALLSYLIAASDTDTCQGSSPAGLQTVKLSTFGKQYASPMAPNFGPWSCINPPCALLSPVIPQDSMLTGTPSVQTSLTWQTGCQHLATNIGCGSTSNQYDFIFTATDNFCPVPAKRTIRFRIVVTPKPPLNSTPIVCASVNAIGTVFLYWDKPDDSLNIFESYHLFTSTQPNGPFAHYDSIFGINQTLFIHSGAGAHQHPVYYLQSVRSYSGGSVAYGMPFDTVSTIFIEITGYDTTQSVAHLTWNPLRINPLPGPVPVYTIFREYPVGSWNVAGITTALSWSDTLPPGNKVVHYQVVTTDSIITTTGPVACQSFSNIVELKITVGSEDPDQAGFSLDQNLPNPADKSTTIPFRLPAAGEVLLIVHDMHGKEVLRQPCKANQGENRIDLDLTGYPAGIYSYSIHYQGNILKKLMMVE